MKVACFILYFKASQDNNTIIFQYALLHQQSLAQLVLGNSQLLHCGILAQALSKDTFKNSTVVCGDTTCLSFQHGPNIEVHWVEIGR